jgi:hypothetical protein
MSLQLDWWAVLNHGGLLIAPNKIQEYFRQELDPLSNLRAEQLRREITRFDGTSEALSPLLDFLLEDLCNLPAAEWQKAQHVDSSWSLSSFTKEQIKPRRIWVGPNGETLPVFVPQAGSSKAIGNRLGVGKSRRLLSRVLEWLRRQQQPLALITNGRQMRLVHAGQDYDAWCEWDIDLWFAEGAPSSQVTAWRKLLDRSVMISSDGKAPGTLLSAILDSRKGQAELSSVLGERVRLAVEELITASHSSIESSREQGVQFDNRDLYMAGTRIIMRCIIALFAEARGLLPVDNRIYQHSYSIDGLRQQLDRRASGRGGERLAQGRSSWPRLVALFNLIYHGSSHEALPVPQYSGNLFKPGDTAGGDSLNRALALLEAPTNPVSDKQVRQILRLLTRTKVQVRQGRRSTWVDGPVDFAALSTEYIGILYEGLLDFELKRAEDGDPIIFLSVGRQPALPLSRLEGMDDKAIKQLFEELKMKDTGPAAEDEGDGEEESSEEEDQTDELELDVSDSDEEPEDVVAEETAALTGEEEIALSATDLERAQAWLERAAEVAGLVKKPRGKSAGNDSAYEQARRSAGKQLCAQLIAPGQFYLVRWGGTRKGAGTFYTRPQLAAPTVRRALQPLAFEPVRTEIDPRTGLEEVVEWIPRKPEVILSLKVSDPTMGSGSFPVSALRFLTEALVQSLYHHQRIDRSDTGAVIRLADGHELTKDTEQPIPLPPDHEGFEDMLRVQLKRHIVERCIYGADIDPLAVELGRMALWVETMDRNLPFGFLDHKLKVGNTLLGTWFDTFREYPAMAWEREGGDKDYQKDKPDRLINHFYIDSKGKKRGDVFTTAIKARKPEILQQLISKLSGQLSLDDDVADVNIHDELTRVFEDLHTLPVHETEKRARLYQEKVLNNPKYHALKERMDLWCALWFWPGNEIDKAPTPATFATPTAEALIIARRISREQKFFHWELEFPDVFTPGRKGFDAKLGNPPWEIQKPNSKEFFSNIDPLYRAYGKQEALTKQVEYFQQRQEDEDAWVQYCADLKARSNWVKYAGHPFGDVVRIDTIGNKKHDLNLGGRSRDGFSDSERLHKKWRERRAQHVSFADTRHPFLHQGSADLNTYKMFLEQSHALLREGGRLGMIVPSGVYSDNGTTALRELFLGHCDWQWLFSFENRDGVFDIHRSYKFCPLIIQKGSKTVAIRTSFMHHNVDDWDQAEKHILAYPREQVEKLSPNSKSIIEIRSGEDLRVLQKIFANCVLLGDKSEHGWGIKYAREFDMTNDSKLFPELQKWTSKGYKKEGPLLWNNSDHYALPVYNAKMFENWDFSSSGWVQGKGRGAIWENLGYPKRIQPEYLMSVEDYLANVTTRNTVKICFKDISTAIHKRTMMSAIVPDLPAVNASPVLRCKSDVEIELLQTVLASFTFDFVAKFKIGYLHLNYFIIAECPLLKGTHFGDLGIKIKRKAIALSCPHESFAYHWICNKHLFNNFSWRRAWAVSDYERLRLKCLLDAIVAHKFGLSIEDFNWILRDTDWPKEFISRKGNTQSLDPKRFWRVDKDKDSELRQTVLTLVAFHDLKKKGLDEFLSQNDDEGWMIPETLRLTDYGLGHDDRAQEHQPVASRLGPRFYDWQLNEDVGRSWKECEAHAELIRRIVPIQSAEEETNTSDAIASPILPSGQQMKLF